MPHVEAHTTNGTKRKFLLNGKRQKHESIAGNLTHDARTKSTPDTARFTKPSRRPTENAANNNPRRTNDGTPKTERLITRNTESAKTSSVARHRPDHSNAKFAAGATGDMTGSPSITATKPGAFAAGFAIAATRSLAMLPTIPKFYETSSSPLNATSSLRRRGKGQCGSTNCPAYR